MKRISIKSYAKINLSLDVLGLNEDGYHEVSMVMQQIELHDDVLVRFISQEERAAEEAEAGADGGSITIELSSNKPYLPRDERNIAYKAAKLMAEQYGGRDDLCGGKIRIDIKKRIPVAAGLAGGSGNAAAVILALNTLWQLRIPMEKMMELGETLGADVPFCIMGQAAANRGLDKYVSENRLASCAALAEGTGTRLTPVPALGASIVLVKPAFSVSTKEVYQGVDEEIARYERFAESGATDFDVANGACEGSPEEAGPDREFLVLVRPDNSELTEGLVSRDKEKIIGNMHNLLELYTLKEYPKVAEIKEKLRRETEADAVLMSGSGPTVYAVYFNKQAAKNAYRKVRGVSREVYLTRTLY